MLVSALVAASLILLLGEHVGIKTVEERQFWVSVVAIGAIVMAIIASFDGLGRWWEAISVLRKWLLRRQPEIAHTTQASIAGVLHSQPQIATSQGSLREALRHEHGPLWRYRQPWLLLTGDATTLCQLLPELNAQGWQFTPDAVLLSSRIGKDGQPDIPWLKQLYKLRRWRPIDAIVLVTNADSALPTAQQDARSFTLALARIAKVLHWSAPVFLLDAAPAKQVSAAHAPVVACELSASVDTHAIEAALQTLRSDLARRYLAPPVMDDEKRHLGELSERLDSRATSLADWLAGLLSHRHPVRGIAFAPYTHATPAECKAKDKVTSAGRGADLRLWQYLGAAARRHSGRPTGRHPTIVAACLMCCVAVIWTAGMLVSGALNRKDIHDGRQAAETLQMASDHAGRLRALLALQQQIEKYEYRTHHHTPLLTRFGLNRDAEVLAALRKPYTQGARQLLITPVQQGLESSLADLARLQTVTLDEKTGRWALGGRDTLKAYLMLANPDRAEADFLTRQLAQHWSTEARISPGEKQDLANRLFQFYARHLNVNPDWKIEPRPELVTGARQTLLAVIGERNARDTVYQGILNGIGDKYPDLALPSLTTGTDVRGLLRSTAIVPGVFTRQAYEGHVAEAIEAAAERREVATDWILVGDQANASIKQDDDSAALRAALTEQYFADYAEHWQHFMNNLQWEPAPTLPAAIDQLKLMADARQSPVIALMKALEYQGGADAHKTSLSDKLVTKAQDIIGKKREVPVAVQADPAGPLGAAFGPVLRLVGQAGPDVSGKGDSSGELSLQRFLDRATALRLRLQQVNASPDADAQARQMAQALFQGKSSELADTQAYAQLVAASLGAEWARMGETLFVRPVAQAAETVLQPAQASLNSIWRQGIAMNWGRAFAGRYPFAKTANDASLPELARFLRPQVGLIDTFLSTQLAGVLEYQGDQWVPGAGYAQVFDPAFLKGINMLRRIATPLLVQGEPQYRFELKPVPTPGLTETVLMLDGQRLHYVNQRESWQAMTWPANNLQQPGTRLQWQTEAAGTSKNHEFGGRWGLVRMLERARIVPIDTATFELTWQASPDARRAKEAETEVAANTDAELDTESDTESLTEREPQAAAPAEMVLPIRYQLRTEIGQGPLEMLALRGFVLPSRIFLAKDLAKEPLAPTRSVPAAATAATPRG